MSGILALCLVWGWYAERTPGAEEQEGRQLVGDLASPRFATRQSASRTLAEGRYRYLPLLERARRSSDPEVRRRAELILTGEYP